jgi:hypothetical protein
MVPVLNKINECSMIIDTLGVLCSALGEILGMLGVVICVTVHVAGGTNRSTLILLKTDPVMIEAFPDKSA